MEVRYPPDISPENMNKIFQVFEFICAYIYNKLT